MKYTFILFFMAVAASVNAQTWVADSVEMGAGYSHDVYYDLSTGNDVRKVANDWDIAFQMTAFGHPMFNASVRANHIHSDVEVYSLHKQASTAFGTLTAADTMVTKSNQLVNQDTSWGRGAFTNNKSSNIFDYGWGMYNSTTHFLTGDSLYLVKANGKFYQLWIQEYISFGAPGTVGYKFRVADWDGANDVTDSIKRVAPYDNRLFAYYNLATKTFSDREPAIADWDLQFRRYQKNGQPGGQDPTKLQPYAGVLTNAGVEVAKLTGIGPNTITSANYQTHTTSMSVETNGIGDDWKRLNQQFSYDIKADTSFIIKANEANGKRDYYQLKFTRFDGAFGPNTGKAVFETRLLASVAAGVDDVTGVSNATYSIYPNPAQNQVNIMVDAKTANNNTMLLVTDITGKVMQHTTVGLNKGLNAYSLNVTNYPAGTYVVSVVNDNFKLTEKVTVQH